MKLLIEAIVVGIMTSILGTIMSYIFMVIEEKKLYVKFDFWMYVVLSNFFTGVLIHYICEYTGLNKYYCKHGNACN
jgi:uncharacterized membrane protein